jgi:hypothetical protein
MHIYKPKTLVKKNKKPVLESKRKQELLWLELKARV